MDKEEFKKIIEQLIVLGEDAEELNHWLDTYDFLEEFAKAELSASLKQELDTLIRMKH